MDTNPHPFLPKYQSDAPCPRCNTTLVSDFGDIGTVCIACLDICIADVMRENKSRLNKRGGTRWVVKTALDLHSALYKADKTPGN